HCNSTCKPLPWRCFKCNEVPYARIRPEAKIAILDERDSISSKECETRMTARLAIVELIKSHRILLLEGSTPELTSSNKRISGLPIIERPNDNLRLLPPE